MKPVRVTMLLLVLLGSGSALGQGSQAGAADVLDLDPTGSPWKADGDQAHAFFGTSVSTGGDVNGDGYQDVVVGAPGYSHGQNTEGRALAYHGSATGLGPAPNWTAESDHALADFGYSVATAGDVNGDGFDDVIVGAPLYDNRPDAEGWAFAYHGSPVGLSPTPNWTAEGNQEGALFGFSVASAGDVNGDGFDDVIVGANVFDNGQLDEGGAFVYHGSPTGLSLTPNWTAEGNQRWVEFGRSVGPAGDLNGDGYADVIVGAHRYGDGQFEEGRALVYHGSASGLSTTPDWTAESDRDFAQFGISVRTAGDVDGDGYADVVVGAWHYSNGQESEGQAFVYRGSASGLSTIPHWTADSDQGSAGFGYSAGTAGDVNGDGYADVIVGAPNFGHGEELEGVFFLFHGSAEGLGAAPANRAEGNEVWGFFGSSVGTAGDVTGDGYAEVIVGAYGFDHPESAEGAAFVYRGRA